MTAQVGGRSVLARVEGALARPTVPAWFFLVLVSVYLVTADYDGVVVNDIHSAAHAAWSLATRGTLDLSGLDLPYDQAWVVEVGDARYSNRFPGVIAAAVPLYALVRPELPLAWPSAVSAAVATAIGVTAVLVALRRLVPQTHALAGAAFLGLGTAVWAVAADGLWSHGITTMWLGLVMAGVVVGGRGRVLAGVAAAGAAFTRPHVTIALLVVAAALWRRDRLSAFAVAAGAITGALGFLVYGRLVFEQWSPTGGYGTGHLGTEPDGVVTGWEAVVWRGENLVAALFAPRVGIVVWYPVVLVAAWALLRNRRSLTPTVVALALGGLTYTVVQLGLARVSGGAGFWGNRTLIEAMVLIWPAAVVATATHAPRRWWRAALALTTAWTVGMHALGAIGRWTPPSDLQDTSNAWFWPLPQGLAASSPAGLAVTLLLAALAGAAAWVVTASRPDVRAAEAGEDAVAVEDGVRGPVGQAG